MNFNKSVKLLLLSIISALFISVCVLPLGAEYVFKKDGSIIKGRIVRDDPTLLQMKTESGATERIGRNEIIRVLYTELYMGKVYIRLTSGEVVEGYQVDEDRDNYTFRKIINKPAEFTIPRNKVMFIARTNPTDLIGEASIEKILLKWSPPFKPAKSYKVYMRENKKGDSFKVIGETDDTSYTLKKLNKSASYEVYVTAIADTGEESLPSEKIITNTIPLPPEDLSMTELLSDDGKTVTLTMTWKPVTDAESRVKSYSIYNTDDDRKKLGGVTTPGYVIKNFPAEGKHRFAVVSVNDLGTESEDAVAMYDSGYRIYARLSGAYLMPLGNLGVIADSGYGGLIDITIGRKIFSAGIETGYLNFSGADKDIKNMTIIPVLAMADYRFPLFYTLFLRPVVKAGTVYEMTEYLKHDTTDPSITDTYTKNVFNPMASGGVYLDLRITEEISITGGAEYSSIFEKSGRMDFLNCTFGASIMF